MKATDIKKILPKIILNQPKWELDTIVYYDRFSNPKTLFEFLSRIDTLNSKKDKSKSESLELSNLLELLDEMDLDECEALLERPEEDAKEAFIEDLARTSAIEVLTNGKISYETMHTACKLSPNDFILCAKRTQDLINSIQGLVIKGETLSKDVAGA